MHELSIAMRIREVLEGELAGDDVLVDTVRLRVGALANIVPEALQFAWPHAMAGSAKLGMSTVEIDFVEVGLRCRTCSATHTTATLVALRCPACRSGDVEVTGGDDLEIVDVDVRERESVAPR